MHIGMDLSGFSAYVPGLRDCGYGPVVQRNRGLYLTRRQFDLLNRLGSMTAKLAAGVIEHVVRAPEQPISLVEMRLRSSGLRVRLGSFLLRGRLRLGCSARDEEHCPAQQQRRSDVVV